MIIYFTIMILLLGLLCVFILRALGAVPWALWLVLIVFILGWVL